MSLMYLRSGHETNLDYDEETNLISLTLGVCKEVAEVLRLHSSINSQQKPPHSKKVHNFLAKIRNCGVLSAHSYGSI